MELAEWRKILAHSLIKSGEVRHSGRGRPSISIEKKLQVLDHNLSVHQNQSEQTKLTIGLHLQRKGKDVKCPNVKVLLL